MKRTARKIAIFKYLEKENSSLFDSEEKEWFKEWIISKKIKRESGNTIDGYPVYTFYYKKDYEEFVVAKRKTKPSQENWKKAIKIDDFWILKTT